MWSRSDIGELTFSSMEEFPAEQEVEDDFEEVPNSALLIPVSDTRPPMV